MDQKLKDLIWTSVLIIAFGFALHGLHLIVMYQ